MASKRFLAIETSSPRLSLALGTEARVLAQFTGEHDWRHAESVFRGIKTMLKKVKWTVQSLDGVAVSTGPGSFTGIRIGLAVARTLGQSLKIPVAGVSSLEILAAGAKTSVRWRAPQIDALRDHVFAALFENTPQNKIKRVISESMVPANAWAKIVRRKARGTIWSPAVSSMPYPEAKILLELARPVLLQGNTSSYKTVLPLYIRKAAAEERRV